MWFRNLCWVDVKETNEKKNQAKTNTLRTATKKAFKKLEGFKQKTGRSVHMESTSLDRLHSTY